MAHFLLITPPLIQLNTAYPATAQLQGFLRSRGVDCHQMDLSIALVDRLLTRDGLSEVVRRAEERFLSGDERPSKALRVILSNASFYVRWVEPVKRFLQGKDLSLQTRFANRNFWPNAKRMPKDEDLWYDYGDSGLYNRAQYFCTLFLEDITLVVQQAVSEHFEMIRYGEHLCVSLSEFDPLYEVLLSPLNLLDEWMLSLLDERIAEMEKQSAITHVGVSVPFPGNLYAALRIAQHLKAHYPHVHVNMGGGYVNTELRQITDTRLFTFIDSLTFDDGELPLLRLAEGGEPVRTITCENGELVRHGWDSKECIPFRELGTPSLDGLNMSLYMDTADTANPMQQLWANGRWLKLMMAHGCYWHGCTFCDTCLDYIGRYDHAPATMIVDRMETMHRESGLSGFHFVDEAMPPAVLRKVAEELLTRGDTFSYWGNIRFEKVYDAELCYLLAQSGCIAVSGGIEVASERVLKLINKGVSVAQVRQTLRHFRDNHILVHAYLMYGFPTETEKELMESLDTVRGLFEEGLIQSAFWHRYAMTCHSPSGRNPESVGAVWEDTTAAPFANNEIAFHCQDPALRIDWERYDRGLKLATQNFMRGAGFDIPVRKWFN